MTFSDISILPNKSLPSLQVEETFGRYRVVMATGDYCLFHDPPTNHPHLHENHYELCLVLRGSGTYRHGAETFALQPGSVFMSDLRVVHEISSFETRDLYLVFFTLRIYESEESLTDNYEDQLIEAFRRTGKTVATGQDHLQDYLPLFARAANGTRGYYRARQTMRMMVLDMLAACTPAPTSPVLPTGDDHAHASASQIERACDYIQRHVQRRILVGEVARAAHCSERHLNRLFRSRLGKTVAAEIRDGKMNFARRQLLMQFGVEQVARAVGIESVAQFSRMFKTAHGVSPKAWQTAHAPREAIPRTLHGAD